MAVGDLVSNVYENTVGTAFQPAASVQICITQFITNDAGYLLGMGDIDTGTNTLNFTSSTGETNNMRYYNGFIHKWFIDNSSYLSFVSNAVGQWTGFTGIQTQ